MSLISSFSIGGTSWSFFWPVWKLISSENDIKEEKSFCTRLWAGRTAWLWLPSCPGRQSRQGDRICDMCQVPCGVPRSSPSLRVPPTPASQGSLPSSSRPCRAGPAAPFHVATAARALQPLVPTRESQVTPPVLPTALQSPTKPLPWACAAFPRSECEQGSGGSILRVPLSSLSPGLCFLLGGCSGSRSKPPFPPVSPAGDGTRGGAVLGQHLGQVAPGSAAAPRRCQPGAFRLFPLAPRPFLPRVSLIFLPVSAGLMSMQIGARDPPKPSSA